MRHIELVKQQLRANPKVWLVTGVAGFIGSNLLEVLLKCGQKVIGLDNFSTGRQRNLDEVRSVSSPEEWARFHFIHGDIRSLDDCRRAMHFLPTRAGSTTIADGEKASYVLHQAALGSVPRSIADPIATNQSNVDGFLNVLVAARDAKVKRLVYAASSSTYGDHPDLPKVEERIGNPMSPYAVTKLVNELYASVFARSYGFESIGLRYFNVFGPRQNPDGDYAAVIPKWINSLINNEIVYINGDGSSSRDFCYVENTVQANLLAATCITPKATNCVYNVAFGERTELNGLFAKLCAGLATRFPHVHSSKPVYRDFRLGDVRHSLASIAKARDVLGYEPTHNVDQGLQEAIDWYVSNSK